MSLERLELFNFQCHERRVVDLDPKVTVFVGSSDAGKTAAAFRSLRWLAFNRPLGDGLLRHGADEIKVRLTLDGGRKVVRSKGKENIYRLDGEKYVDLRQPPVPQPISDLLNVGEVNFQAQLDPPWWFLKSPGEVSKELNDIVDLGLIDRTMANLAAKHRQAEAAVKVCEMRLKESEEKASSLAWVPECRADMDELERTNRRLEEHREKSRTTAALLKGVRGAREAVKTLSRACTEVQTVIAAGAAWQKASAKADRIRYHLRKLSYDRSEILTARKAEKAARERREESGKGLCPVCGKPMKE